MRGRAIRNANSIWALAGAALNRMSLAENPEQLLTCSRDEGNGCYVDLQSSSCGQPGAVQCSQLSAGVEEACCPQFTTCAEGYNATTTAARCNIKEIALQAMASSAPPTIESATKTEKSSSEADFISTLSSATTMGASSLQSVYSTVETPSEASTLATPDGGYPVAADSTTPSSSNGMAGGTIAGVTVGAFAVVVLLALAVWYVRRIIGRARLRNASSDRYDAQLGSQKEPQIPHTEPGPLGTTAIARDLGDNRHHDLWAGDSLKGTQTREVAELESGTG